MKGFATSIALCPHDADDILQDVSISILRNYDRFKSFSQKGKEGYLFTLIRNKFIDTKRSQARKKRDEVYLIEKYQPAEAYSKLELRDVKKEMVKHRVCYSLELYSSGYSVKEIAKITNVGINTALGRMRYGRKHLNKAR